MIILPELCISFYFLLAYCTLVTYVYIYYFKYKYLTLANTRYKEFRSVDPWNSFVV